jgi:hypothetical protein
VTGAAKTIVIRQMKIADFLKYRVGSLLDKFANSPLRMKERVAIHQASRTAKEMAFNMETAAKSHNILFVREPLGI